MLHKAWNSKGEIHYCFPRLSIEFQGHTGQNITDFDPNWAFPDYRLVAAFKSLRFALLIFIFVTPEKFVLCKFFCICLLFEKYMAIRLISSKFWEYFPKFLSLVLCAELGWKCFIPPDNIFTVEASGFGNMSALHPKGGIAMCSVDKFLYLTEVTKDKVVCSKRKQCRRVYHLVTIFNLNKPPNVHIVKIP